MGNGQYEKQIFIGGIDDGVGKTSNNKGSKLITKR